MWCVPICLITGVGLMVFGLECGRFDGVFCVNIMDVLF